ncbi:MAG: hypothetical protein R3B90_08005 [Planctomycetaceae bacterium]
MSGPGVRRQGWRRKVCAGLLSATCWWWSSTTASPAADRLGEQPPAGQPAERPRPLPAHAAASERPDSPSVARSLLQTAEMAQETTAQMRRLWEQRRYLERRRLNHLLYRQRGRDVALEAALRQLEGGEPIAGLLKLRDVCTALDDTLVWDEATNRPTSVRNLAADHLRHLEPAQRERYERLVGAAADAALAKVDPARTVAGLIGVVRGYPGTKAAQRAELSLARLYCDQGRFAESEVYWRSLLSSGGLANCSPRDRLAARLCWRPRPLEPVWSHSRESRTLSYWSVRRRGQWRRGCNGRVNASDPHKAGRPSPRATGRCRMAASTAAECEPAGCRFICRCGARCGNPRAMLWSRRSRRACWR